MRFEVPQFIEVEDKIFGPLSWRQFLYVGGGVGMSVVIFFTMPLIVFLIFGLPLAVLAAALAFYPINNRPFSYFLEALFTYISTTRLYLWRQKNTNIVHKNSTTKQHARTAPQPSPATAPTKKTTLTSLSRKLELEALQKTDI